MDANEVRGLPAFLQSFANLSGHFDEHFEPLDSNQRGDAFLDLSLKLVPFTETGQRFPRLHVSEKKSHDQGVDLASDPNTENQVLCVQAKYKIHSKDEFDTIVSKFAHFEALQNQTKNAGIFPAMRPAESGPSYIFMIVTFSKLDTIRGAYLASQLASRDYYTRLDNERRLHILDGPQILTLFQRLYRKTHLLPNALKLSSATAWLAIGTVCLGVIRGSQLLSLYEEHGDSLFFENIRDFLGATSGKKVEDRETVNQEIIRTIKGAPQKMLERNNGITFRAARVNAQDENVIVLEQGAIVNGCQTTMCLVHCGDQGKDCLVQVKVVETADAWDIAKAANYQNPVARIELDLAKYLRPQVVQKAATDLGYGVKSKTGGQATTILDAVHQEHVDYEEMKCLYLGFFSRKPNNLFDANYTDLRADLLERLYQDPGNEQGVFETLFLILKNSRDSSQKCAETLSGREYSTLFKRFFQDEKPRYRAYLAVLSVCGALRTNLCERSSDLEVEAARMKQDFVKTRELLENRPRDYTHTFLLAFQVLADIALEASSTGSETEVAQNMFQKVSKSPFNTLYTKLLMRIDFAKSSG
jgi:hypothetical protein